MSENLFLLFRAQARVRPDAFAMAADTGERLTYAQLESSAGRFAAALAARGVAPGDRVVVQAAKCVDAVALYLGCLQLGAVYVPLNTAYTDAEVGYFLSDCRPVLFVHDTGREPVWPQSATLQALAKQSANLAPISETTPRAPGDLAAICYTSGTTGRSKGAMLTHANLASNARTLIGLWHFSEADTLLHILPIFHVHGLFVALHCALLSGAAIRFEASFNAARTRALLPQCTVLMGVPTNYTRLLGDAEFGHDDCAKMRLFLCGSAPLLAETHREFESRTGLRILERYGMTEAGMITSNPYDGERAAGTVGYPLPDVEVRVRGDDGELAATGNPGVLEIRGPNVFSGYWEMPDKTAESFTQDGWFVTGDVVVQEVDGRLSIVGRAKDLIIAGGYNIYPKEIESVIDELPWVEESAVVGIPHPDFGESVVAVIAVRAGSEPDRTAVEALVAERLARFKHPRQVHFVDALPRNTMGKVQKAELRSRYAE
jgi:malonyl-CoA/methylmalonyl-CoA synthetase